MVYLVIYKLSESSHKHLLEFTLNQIVYTISYATSSCQLGYKLFQYGLICTCENAET